MSLKQTQFLISNKLGLFSGTRYWEFWIFILELDLKPDSQCSIYVWNRSGTQKQELWKKIKIKNLELGANQRLISN
jgi:hypothetical protein